MEGIIDCELLIDLVHARPALWDREDRFHSNRNAVKKLWLEISNQMNIDEFALRRKWRYLRDQFAVELGKASNVEDEVITTPKWPYFKHLLFLKEIVRVRAGNIRKHYFNNGEDTEEDVEISRRHQSMDMNRYIEDEPVHIEIKEEHTVEDAIELEIPENPRKRRRVASEDDEHVLFFKSLLPHIDKIPPHMILRFRNRIQDVVAEFVYPSN